MLKSYGIKLSDLAHLMGCDRKTLSRIKNNRNPISPYMQKKLDEFEASWTWNEDQAIWHQEGWCPENFDNYTVSNTGYLYQTRVQRERENVQNEFKPVVEKHDHLVEFKTRIMKTDLDAMIFHKEKPEFPIYDAWMTCVQCDFRIKGNLRKRLETPQCPNCGNDVRPCLDCIHYSKCASSRNCVYRRRIEYGIKCRECGKRVSSRDNDLLRCGCGYINSWKDPKGFAEINQEAGFGSPD